MLSTDVLLTPRFKVIADYPDSPFGIGQILSPSQSGGKWYDKLEQYPAIFQRLQWASDRNIADLPEYVKDHKGVYKVIEWDTSHPTHTLVQTERGQSLATYYEPSTLTEYEAYKTK